MKPDVIKSTFLTSDNHLFHPKKSIVFDDLQLVFSTVAQRHHMIGDVIDFEQIVYELSKFKKTPADFESFNDALTAIGTYRHLDEDWAEHHKRYFDAIIRNRLEYDTETVYVTGNHDLHLNALFNQTVQGITICETKTLETKRGLLAEQHGHMQDPWFKNGNYSGFTARFGCLLLGMALASDRTLQSAAQLITLDRLYPQIASAYPITHFGKAKLKPDPKEYRRDAVKDLPHDFIGAICGHNHMGDIREEHGKLYVNTGTTLTSDTMIGVFHSDRGGFEYIERSDIPNNAARVKENANPLAQWRPRTEIFLQTLWKTYRDAYIERTQDNNKTVKHDDLTLAKA